MHVALYALVARCTSAREREVEQQFLAYFQQRYGNTDAYHDPRWEPDQHFCEFIKSHTDSRDGLQTVYRELHYLICWSDCK